MAGKKKTGDQRARRGPNLEDWIYRVVCVSALLIPLTVSPSGRDSFRIPKELVFRAEMIVLVALILSGLFLSHLDWKSLRWRHPAIVMPIVIVVWTAVTTFASTNRALSMPALGYAAGTALVFIATFLVASKRDIGMLRWVAWAGIINSILYLGVALGAMKNPLGLDTAYKGHHTATGLLGNSNDVGAAILPIAICAIAAALASKKHRPLFTITAVLAILTILVSVSVAAIGATLVGIAALALVWDWKRALVAVSAIVLGLGVLSIVHQPLKYRVGHMIEAARSARWDELSSGRLTAFAAALEMFRHHPVIGVGPGTFGWHYYPYKLEVSERDPELFTASGASRFNFEEAHNDHLEVLSETGAPGYVLFLSCLIFVASGSLRQAIGGTNSDPCPTFARLAQLPLAVATGVVALAQYPLQLTSSLTTLIFLIALSAAWRTDLKPADSRGSDHA